MVKSNVQFQEVIVSTTHTYDYTPVGIHSNLLNVWGGVEDVACCSCKEKHPCAMFKPPTGYFDSSAALCLKCLTFVTEALKGFIDDREGRVKGAIIRAPKRECDA